MTGDTGVTADARTPKSASAEMGALKWQLLAVDIGFVVYWAISLLHLLPPDAMYAHYDDPVVRAWNFSFLPLDLAVSASGFGAVALARSRDPRWRLLAILSLTLTSVSGLQAVAFWALRRDWDPSWWLPNLVLLLYPLPHLRRLLAGAAPWAPQARS